MIEKVTIARDDSIYHAWPDVTIAPDGRLVCIFSECTHHSDRSYTRIMLTDSFDQGCSWSPKRALTEGTAALDYYYNCARISTLKDGRLAVVVDRCYNTEKDDDFNLKKNYLYFSADNGQTWTDAIETPIRGIVPDQLVELSNGRWIIGAHYREPGFDKIVQRCWYSDDKGKSWQGPSIVGMNEDLNLCEVSIIEFDGTLVAFMRENSFLGYDCYKAISHDFGKSWSGVIKFPLPGCHRPVAHQLNDGRVVIGHRFLQGGQSGFGKWCQNYFVAITDAESCLSLKRRGAWTRILPVDFDRSSHSDTGYSGIVQLNDDEIYVVNYIVDDAPKGQIRGYRIKLSDFILE